MKKILKVLGILLLIIIAGIAGVSAYVKFALPNVGDAPKLKVDASPAIVARGEYLANHVFICMDCHSTRNWSEFAGPLTPGTLGKGGEEFGEAVGFPGTYYSRNITPAGIGKWTDGEIFRTITTGVDREGKPLFPVMPYHSYGKMDEEDIKAVIAYLRTLPSIENKPPASHSNFPVSILINTMPAKATLSKAPSPSDTLAYGKYLFTGSACHDCHTPFEKGKFIEELSCAGGREFTMPSGTIRSANLTPDMETGLGNWSRQAFLDRFKFYTDSTHMHRKVDATEMQTIMPWLMYAGMTDSDLGSIYTYLRSLKPVNHSVVKFTPKKS